MRFIRRLFTTVFILIPALCVLAVAVVPGPHRVVAPTSFGLTQVGPGVFTDEPSRGDAFLAMLAQADQNAAAFFGRAHPRWRVVLCTTRTCQEAFGLTARAMALADLAILVAPSGLRPATLHHEQIHIELAARMGPAEAIVPRYPAWFNEGLATYLSGTPGVKGPARVADAQWITSARTALGWRMAKRGRSPAEYYGAARRNVAEIDARLGRDGLRALVEDVANGADFDAALQAALRP